MDLVLRRYLHDLRLVAVNWLLRCPPHALRIAVLRRLVRAQVGAGCSIERRVRVESTDQLNIGPRTTINTGVLLDNRGGLTIGTLVNISPHALVLSSDHDPASPTFEDRKRPVVLHDRCWIGTRAIVLPGAEVGEGAIVAAGAVAHGQVPAWTIVAGNPAAPIGGRPRDAQAELPRFRRPLY
ncbi:MAG: acyltransferase [Thermoleophilaceae bacterium]